MYAKYGMLISMFGSLVDSCFYFVVVVQAQQFVIGERRIHTQIHQNPKHTQRDIQVKILADSFYTTPFQIENFSGTIFHHSLYISISSPLSLCLFPSHSPFNPSLDIILTQITANVLSKSIQKISNVSKNKSKYP